MTEEEARERVIRSMCPEKVCRTCGEPSRRVINDRTGTNRQPALAAHIRERRRAAGVTLREVNEWFGFRGTMSRHWEDSKIQPAIPSPEVWPILKERLGLSDEFDDMIYGGNLAEYVPQSGPGKGTAHLPAMVNPAGRGFEWHEATRQAPEVFSDCGHDDWRPGKWLDPFA